MLERSTPRFTVQVEISVVKTEQHVLVVLDESDMKHQIAEREAAFRATAFVSKPQRDKRGEIILHQLQKDWNV